MGTTTFSGPVRSENGFQTITKNTSTGAITVTSGDKMAVEATGGAGIEGTAAVYITQVNRLKSDVTTNVNIVKTTIMIDLTGLNCGGTAGDIIGADGAGVAVGRVVSITGNVVSYLPEANNEGGYVDFADTNTVYKLGVGSIGTISGAPANPEVAKHTGRMMYIENRGAVTRASDQIEDIKLIIEM